MDIPSKVLEINGFKEFNPMQKKVVKKGIGKSVVVSSPTASGKTIIAELFALESIINDSKKVMYTCPLRALASEHYADFKKKFSDLKIKTTISTGELDSRSSHLGKFDLIFTTYEKADSLFRHKTDWLQSIGTLVVDEIHELDSDRGPTLEMLITKFRKINPKIRIVGLSATIPNAKELAEWLDAELIESDYRPIPLTEGVFFNNTIRVGKRENPINEKGDPIEALVRDTLSKGKQALVFANSRRRAASIAQKLAHVSNEYLNEKEKNSLQKVKDSVLNAMERPTQQCRKLGEAIEMGSAFHHAGLVQKQRHEIEEKFREGKIKVISSTPTLAAGINIPAQTVIIPSLYRYTKFGNNLIPVREYKQMVGRCVLGDTFVCTNKGFVTVEELFSQFKKDKNMEICCVDTKLFKSVKSKIKKVFKRKTDSYLEIKTRSGKTINVTKEHPFFTFKKLNCGKPMISEQSVDYSKTFGKVIDLKKSGKVLTEIVKKLNMGEHYWKVKHWFYGECTPLPYAFVWKKAEELKKGNDFKSTDYLSLCLNYAFPINNSPQDFLPWDKIKELDNNIFMMKQGKTKVKFPKYWSSELVRFVAKIMSDGCLTYNKNDNSYQIRYYNNNETVQKEYQKMIEFLFGKKISYKWRRGSFQSGFKSFVVGQFLNNIGVPHGKKSFKLVFPKPFFSFPKNYIVDFFKEYCACDGWEEPGRYCIISSSERFINEYGLVLSSHGFVPRIYKKKPNSFRKKPIYELSITKTQIDKLSNFKTVGDLFPDQIKSIKKIEKQCYVYDISVEHHHNFIANGLVVHNSGRPKYDSEGRAVIIAKHEDQADDYQEQFVYGQIEEITSKMGIEPILRTHLLALIASNYITDLNSMESFFEKTFYAKQYSNMQSLFSKLNGLLQELNEMNFVELNETEFNPTPLGKRVAELYIDPITAFNLLTSLEKDSKKDLAYLFMVADTFELRPYPRVSSANESLAWAELMEHRNDLFVDVEKKMYDDQDLSEKFRLAKLFHEWISETDDQKIADDFNIPPGILQAKLRIGDWIVYSAMELEKVLGKNTHFKELKDLRLRLKYGIRKEILPLVQLKGIGRVRARMLFSHGFATIASLKKADLVSLSRVIGKKVALSVKEQLGQKGELSKEESKQLDLMNSGGQTSLNHF